MTKMRGFRKGLTMIEVLVSLLIFLTVLLAIYQLFDTSHSTYASGTRKQDVQQQARLAMDEMVRALRMAGYVPENFDDLIADVNNSLRIHMGSDSVLAVFGSLDGNLAESAVFLFCRSGTTLLSKRTPNTTAAAYTCNGDVLADNVTAVQFTYFDTNGAQVVGTQINPGPPPVNSLDGQIPGTAADLSVGAARAQRDAVRTIVITLQITEQVPRQQDQVYTLTSTVRLRNLNNT
jgi:prepilin-type N-terminal cleavage/methylation domain-containing protein